MNAIAALASARLVPVAVIPTADDALPLADALLAGGLNVIEVTLRTPDAIASIRTLRAERPDLIVGVGTVIDADVVPRLADMGVGFLVSPGLNERVVEAAQRHNLPITPGVMTPGEVERGRALGLDTLKFFPAENAGGAAMLKALGGPYGHTGLKFIPTGGINAARAPDYWALPNVLAVGGSWFVDRKLVEAGSFDEITKLTEEAVALARA